jgi:flavin-dependent dehydrogenase
MTGRVYDPMIACAAERRQVRLKDGTTATLVDWRRNGDTVKVITPEYRHRVLPKGYIVEVLA